MYTSVHSNNEYQKLSFALYRIRGDGLSDIGRSRPDLPSLPESFFEGTRWSRARGLYEQEMAIQAVMMIVEEYPCVGIIKVLIIAMDLPGSVLAGGFEKGAEMV
jgi:hypothetical protein